jgi:hypothetical protein
LHVWLGTHCNTRQFGGCSSSGQRQDREADRLRIGTTDSRRNSQRTAKRSKQQRVRGMKVASGGKVLDSPDRSSRQQSPNRTRTCRCRCSCRDPSTSPAACLQNTQNQLISWQADPGPRSGQLTKGCAGGCRIIVWRACVARSACEPGRTHAAARLRVARACTHNAESAKKAGESVAANSPCAEHVVDALQYLHPGYP